MSEPNPERDTDFGAISESDIWEEARDRLQICVDRESDNRNLAKIDMRFREGDQWDHDTVTTASEEKPELTINLTDAMVRRVVNNIKEQRPRGKSHPVGDGADIETSEVINGLGRHVETRSEASVAYDTAADCAVDGGFGYFRLLIEYVSPRSFQKEMRIVPILDVFTVYMDPAAIMPSGSDMNWCLISTKMKRTEYKRLYPRADNAAWVDTGRDSDQTDWEDREEIRLAEYFRIREVKKTLCRITDTLQQREFTAFEQDLPATLPEGQQIIEKRPSAERQVEWFRLNGVKVIERAIFPGQWIPVFRVSGNMKVIDGQIVRRGMVRFMQDPQRMVNYGEVAKIRRLALTPQSPWVVAEGQLDGHPEWNDAHRDPYVPLTYKPVIVETGAGPVLAPPPQRQPPAGVEQGFAEFIQGMRSNLLAVAGAPNEPGQDLQGQVVSGKALRRRDKLSDQSHSQYYDNVGLAIAQCWRVMLEWFPAVYQEPGRIQRIIGEDSTPQMVTLNEPVQEQGDQGEAINRVRNDLSVGRYDVVMDMGPGYETKREEGAENLIELLNVQALAEIIAKTGPDLVFRSIDHPYMQELADRLMAQTPEGLKKVMAGLSGRAKSLVQSMAAQIQQLQQALQQAALEKKYDLAGKHLAAATKAHDTEVNAETKRLDTAVKAHTALAVEEIKAGASLMNTHVEAEHHAAEAERMIERGQTAESEA